MQIVKVKAISKTGTKEPVYNMEVDNLHNYISNDGIILHNCYDSLGYGLISYHIGNTKPVNKDKKPPHVRYKERLMHRGHWGRRGMRR